MMPHTLRETGSTEEAAAKDAILKALDGHPMEFVRIPPAAKLDTGICAVLVGKMTLAGKLARDQHGVYSVVEGR